MSRHPVSFSIIKTGDSTTVEGLTYRGGKLRQQTTINYSAILVQHPKGNFLFDSGLGSRIDDQYQADMPKWKRPLLKYRNVSPAHQQLAQAQLQIQKIFLSHGHWDHASGLVDFPDAEVWVTENEKRFLDHVMATKKLLKPSVMPSQVGSAAIDWHFYEFAKTPYKIFDQSFDIFGDETVVLVPLPGHTPGSVGLFVTLANNREYFFCGDTVWNARAITDTKPKPFVATIIADHDRPLTLQTIRMLRNLTAKYPDLTIVPAHDAATQDKIGYYPVVHES